VFVHNHKEKKRQLLEKYQYLYSKAVEKNILQENLTLQFDKVFHELRRLEIIVLILEVHEKQIETFIFQVEGDYETINRCLKNLLKVIEKYGLVDGLVKAIKNLELRDVSLVTNICHNLFPELEQTIKETNFVPGADRWFLKTKNILSSLKRLANSRITHIINFIEKLRGDHKNSTEVQDELTNLRYRVEARWNNLSKFTEYLMRLCRCKTRMS